jgi:protein O-GlcNAc transferase
MSKVVSFALWGTNKVYNEGLMENIKLVRELLPGFVVVVYCTPEVTILQRDLQGVDVRVITDHPADFSFIKWRYEPMFDKSVEVCLVRDADSRITRREVRFVTEWLESGLPFHIMRDSSSHRSKIMGGMFGVRGGFVSHLQKQFSEHIGKCKRYGIDEEALAEVIYPLVREHAMYHLSESSKKFPGEKNIIVTMPPTNSEPFIGEVITDLEEGSYIRIRTNTQESNTTTIWAIVLVLAALFLVLLSLTKTKEYVFNFRRN